MDYIELVFDRMAYKFRCFEEKNGKYRLGEVATVRSGLVLSRKQARTAGGIRYRALTLRSIEPDGSVDMGALDDYFAVGALPPDHLSQAGDVIVRLTSPYTAVLVDGDTAGLVVSSNFVMVRIHSCVFQGVEVQANR